ESHAMRLWLRGDGRRRRRAGPACPDPRPGGAQHAALGRARAAAGQRHDGAPRRL
ncbi:MAG: hypothetical protein AVDCRST_MAG10-405, partial [uncultured Acidimicrobiales bacterium]